MPNVKIRTLRLKARTASLKTSAMRLRTSTFKLKTHSHRVSEYRSFGDARFQPRSVDSACCYIYVYHFQESRCFSRMPLLSRKPMLRISRCFRRAARDGRPTLILKEREFFKTEP